MKQRKVRREQRRSRHLRNLSHGSLPKRSESARDRALHVLAAMRRDPSLSLTRAAKLQRIKAATVKKYFPSGLNVSSGKFRVATRDRYSATLFIPDSQGNPVPVKTRSSKERKELSNYLRDLGRYLRGDRNALARWQGKKIAGNELVTDARTIKLIEPALSDFSLYRTLNGGGI
jgi:hypothetical protein